MFFSHLGGMAVLVLFFGLLYLLAGSQMLMDGVCIIRNDTCDGFALAHNLVLERLASSVLSLGLNIMRDFVNVVLFKILYSVSMIDTSQTYLLFQTLLLLFCL